MAIIYSYPIATPKSKDLLIGTSVFDENDPSSERTNPTVSFTVQSLINLIGPIIGTPNLQQVTGAGNTTTNSITIANSLSVNGSYIDSYGQSGSDGQVLTSQGTGTQTRWLASTGGVTSVGQSHEGDAFSVTGSPITSAGTLAIEMEGSALQYINGLGNLVLLSTLPQGAVTSLTTTGTSGASTLTSGVLNIPNYANTQNTLTTVGTSGDATLVSEVLNIPNYTYTLPIATSSDLGGIKIGYTDNAKNYAVELDTDNEAFVNVPWTDTQPNPFQTITGTGTDNTDSGIILSNGGGTVLILGDGTVITAAQTGNTITLTGVNTWVANTDTADGYVLKGENQDSKVWKTDASGVPGWRDDATIPDTGITSVVMNTGADETEPLAESIIGRQLTLTSNVFGGGTKVGYVPVNTDGTQFLRGDGNWASIPTGLNYQGVWAASTTAEVATQSGTNLTIVTADASLIVGTIVEGTGISGTVKIATVTDSSTFVLDTSVTVSVGTILTMSAPGGAPVLTGTGLQGDGILYICTVAGKAYPNNFRSTTPIATPGDWNVGDWCVFTGTAGTGEWTRIPATNAGVTSATTTDGSFIEYSPVLSGSAGAITIGADLSAGGTASNTTFLRGDNQWAVPSYSDPGVTTFTNENGTFISAGTVNTDATGAVTTGIIDLSATGTKDSTTFLRGDNTWDVPVTGVTSITGQEPITIVTTGGPTATTPRIDLRYADSSAAADDNVVTACPEDQGTILLTGSDTLLINDATEGSNPAVLNVVRKFSLDRLKTFIGSGDITGVTAGVGLDGGGSSGNVTLDVEYTGTGNVILAANTPATLIDSGSIMLVNTNTGANASVNQIAISDVPLSFFSNTVSGFTNNTGTLTGVIGEEPLYSVTTGGGSATVPQIKLRYNEDSAGNNDSIITAAPAFGAGTADPSDLIIISDQSTNLNETKKIALSQLGFATAAGDITAVAAGDGLTGGGTSGDVTVSVMYTGTNNVILDATASTDHESTSKMMLSYDNGDQSAPVVNEMKLEDIQLGYFDNNLDWVVLGNTSTTALAGDTTTITTAQAQEITANTAKVTDTGLPAVIAIADGTLSFGNGNVTAATVRAKIGAGTSSTVGTVTNVGTGSGLTGGAITATGTISVDYSTATDNIILGAASATTTSIPNTGKIMYDDGNNGVKYAFVSDLPFTSSTGDISGVTAGTALSGGGTSGTVTLNVRYAGTSSVIFSATDATGTDIDSDDVILYTDSAGATVNYGSVSDLNFLSNTTTTITTAQASAIVANTAKVSDTGVPAILSNGTVPTLNSGITAAEVRTLIGAGTSSTTGTVTSVGGTGTVSGLTLTGTVTSTGNLTLGGTLSLTSANVTDGLGYTPLQSETDTLADVTARGGASAGSTSTACSFTNTGAQQFGSSGLSDVFLGGQSGNYIRFHTSSNGNTYFDMNCGFVYWRQASSTRFEQNMTNGTFTASGDVVAFGSPSDKRLKENIKPIESALDKAMKLQGVTFDWKKSDSILSIKKDIGFIAQDVQKVAPELVRENEDGYLSMRHQGITPILLEAIKELKAEIEELKLNKCNCNK